MREERLQKNAKLKATKRIELYLCETEHSQYKCAQGMCVLLYYALLFNYSLFFSSQTQVNIIRGDRQKNEKDQ